MPQSDLKVAFHGSVVAVHMRAGSDWLRCHSCVVIIDFGRLLIVLPVVEYLIP